MSTAPPTATRRLHRWSDPQWWVALLAAPVFFVALAQAGVAVTGPAWIAAHTLLFVLLALVYPVLEEIVFRGMIQGWLTDRLSPWRFALISKANLLTSLLFTGVHFFSHPPLWAAAVFIPSLAFGHFRERHQGLVSPILLHAFYNGGYFALFGAPV